jgi:regulator of protease activity HflC (stomatin/prohibitin superfamily)
MKEKIKEYEEKKEFNPTLWIIRKRFFGLYRYTLNLFFLLLGAGFFFMGNSLFSVPTVLFYLITAIFLLIALSLRIAFEWERVPVLRFGRLSGTKGPGVFFVIPLVDVPYDYVDCRITVTDFSAEKVLTKDAVPVYVDAIIFWMIWDAAKAKLEVENYQNAVPLSGKTALRDIIGKNTLSRLLTDRNAIGEELQKILDAKTNPWGITALSVEIKDIVIPRELEDSISKEAQAEREKNARVILGSAEIELSEKYAAASQNYKGNEEAMMLRSLNLLIDGVKNKGSMILVPSETPNLMNKALSVALAKKMSDPNLPDNEAL